MVGDLRFISVTPGLPFFFHPLFQKGRMSFTIPFFTRVQRCLLLSEHHPPAGEIYRRLFIVLPTFISILFEILARVHQHFHELLIESGF